jgi:GT2 family glycosyltransferase
MVKVRTCVCDVFISPSPGHIFYTHQGLHCAAPESDYILFLDDDVAIYPHTIQKLLDMLSSDPNLFMVTGWPYDVLPSNNMPIACLCRIVYRWFSMFPLFKQRVP